MQTKVVTAKSWRTFWRVAGLTVLVLAVVGALVVHRFRQRLPAALMQDIRAGIAARNIPDADLRFQKYLEGRYGPLSDPANRRKAFLDFFNVEHIRALQLLVKHSPENMRQANINASAKWVEQYRQSLNPQEHAELSTQLQSPEGRAMLQQATAQYNSQDVEYRGQTAPVISQLLKTIASLQHP
jgi:hypothetical protein